MRLFLNKIYLNHPRYRRIILVILDSISIQVSLILSFWITSPEENIAAILREFSWTFYLPLIFAIPIYFFTGQYKSLTKYFDIHSIYYLLYRNLIITVLIFLFGYLTIYNLPNFNTLLLFCILTSFISMIYRLILRDILYSLSKKNVNKVLKVSIVGTGPFAVQLALSLRANGDHKILNFIDDDKSLWHRDLLGLPIIPLKKVSKMKIMPDQIFLALPELSRSSKKFILDKLDSLQIPILQIPSIEDLREGRAKVDQLRPLLIEDLLGRDPIKIDNTLLNQGIKDKIICVTGAGGSIGSELCRQIISLRPKVLILLERNEPSLYYISEELKKKIINKNIVLKSYLGCAANKIFTKKLFKDNKVEVIFHAAAYKHVPLVEDNPMAGIYNNSIATYNICDSAEKTNVQKFIFVSTDKSVRPTNVMGASKRLAEMIVQAYAEKNSKKELKTNFSMVRFGNVLASSGSVVPLFRDQIKRGGPITITHPKIIRYFMTIKEASQLVIQAASFSKGGDLFLLDMGEPVLIKDLAMKMIKLSGLSIKSENNENGDIEIQYTGLRPGEKLYEELLIDAESKATENPFIFTAKENFIPYSKLVHEIEELKVSLNSNNQKESLKVLSRLVPEWKMYTDKPFKKD